MGPPREAGLINGSFSAQSLTEPDSCLPGLFPALWVEATDQGFTLKDMACGNETEPERDKHHDMRWRLPRHTTTTTLGPREQTSLG